MQNWTHFLRKIKCFMLKICLEGNFGWIPLRSVLPHVNLKDWQERLSIENKSCTRPMESRTTWAAVPDSSSYLPIHKRKNNHIYCLHQNKDYKKLHLEMCRSSPKFIWEKIEISGFSLNMHICKLAHTYTQWFFRFSLFLQKGARHAKPRKISLPVILHSAARVQNPQNLNK